MKCPNCSNNIEFGNACNICGIDTVLFKNTIRISDLLYNKGLTLAQAGDLSNAKDSLNKSIQFNKNNYYARNLLGLVYCEIGHVADALKQWIISSSLVSENNPATKYIENLQNSGKDLDLYNDAIKMYNQALKYIVQKSDDLAIIQLKKALEINPKLVDALNLLSFCYLIQDDKALASDLVKKVLAIDCNNPIALNYYKVIHQTKRAPKPVINITETKRAVYAGQGANRISKEEHKKSFGNKFYFSGVISFIVGAAFMLLISYLFILPSISSDDAETIATLQYELEELESLRILDSMEHENALRARDSQISDLNATLATLSAEVDVQDRLNRMTLARETFESGEIVEAASIVYAISDTGFSDEEIERLENLRMLVFASAANILYNEGLAHVNADELDLARRAFETVLLYAPEGASYLPDTTYQLGVIAESEEDFERAIAIFTAVIENFPNSNRAANAQTRINNIISD
ncbi:MAG: tetratricopeptide repeat protein [Defluviitaleaceae bacterium]|nr:tetratricopeptide repeat protein [Defluviitaleaceae bacterium]